MTPAEFKKGGWISAPYQVFRTMAPLEEILPYGSRFQVIDGRCLRYEDRDGAFIEFVVNGGGELEISTAGAPVVPLGLIEFITDYVRRRKWEEVT